MERMGHKVNREGVKTQASSAVGSATLCSPLFTFAGCGTDLETSLGIGGDSKGLDLLPAGLGSLQTCSVAITIT